MNHNCLLRFLQALAPGQHRSDDEWITYTCPLAPYTHDGGSERHPSFRAHVNDEGESLWRCFTCAPDASGLGRLLHLMWLCSGSYPREAAELLRDYEVVVDDVLMDERAVVSAIDRRYGVGFQQDKGLVPISRDIVERFPLLLDARGVVAQEARDYLVDDRNISLEAIALYGVRVWLQKRALVFPFTDRSGNVFGLRARKWNSKTIFTINSMVLGDLSLGPFPSYARAGAWFGLHLYSDDQPVYLTEGEIDALRMTTLGTRNVIASGPASVTTEQMDMITPWRIYLAFDSDKAGRRAHHKLRRHYNSAILSEIDWGVAGCKDAGDVPDYQTYEEILEKEFMIS